MLTYRPPTPWCPRFTNGVYATSLDDVRRVARALGIPLDILRYCILPHMHSADWDILQFTFGGSRIHHPFVVATRAAELDLVHLAEFAKVCHVPDITIYRYALKAGSLNVLQLTHHAAEKRFEDVKYCIRHGRTDAIKILCDPCWADYFLIDLTTDAIQHNQFEIFKYFLGKICEMPSSIILDALIRANRIEMTKYALSRVSVDFIDVSYAHRLGHHEIAEMLDKHITPRKTTSDRKIHDAFKQMKRNTDNLIFPPKPKDHAAVHAAAVITSAQKQVKQSRNPRKR